MKLGIFINQTFYCGDGRPSTDLSFVRFIESFGEYFDEILVFAPSLEQPPKGLGHYECSEQIRLCAIPFFGNVKELAKKASSIIPDTKKILKNEICNCDVVWVVGPHPLGLLAYRIASRNHIPIFYHIRGNILNDVGTRYGGKEYWLAWGYAQYMHYASKFLAKRVPTMVVGSELYEIYKPYASSIFQISPSLIRKADVELSSRSVKEKVFAGTGSIKLLFVGRPEPEKGLEYLFLAMQRFNEESSVPCFLTIVGVAQKGSEAKGEATRRRASVLGLDASIEWKGYVAYGDELIKVYREADIFVLPSLAEGIPKVLYEAMAVGVPVISTNVGGIPDIISHRENGFLITPGSSDDLYDALMEVTRNEPLRHEIVAGGLVRALEHTMEVARDQMLRILNECEIPGLNQIDVAG